MAVKYEDLPIPLQQWLDHVEGFSTRHERLVSDMEHNLFMLDWILAAYQLGYETAQSQQSLPSTLDWPQNPLFPWPHNPNDKDTYWIPSKCAKCGLSLEPVMGYVCTMPDCPTFTKAIC